MERMQKGRRKREKYASDVGIVLLAGLL